MIKRYEELTTDIRPQLKDGIGDTTILNITDTSGLNDKGRLYSIMSLEPGSSIGKHTHINEREIYHILEGTGLIYDNGTDVIVKPGDVHITYSNEVHGISNIGSTPLKFIALIIMN